MLHPDSSVTRELILVKLKASQAERQGIIATSDIFRAKIVDVSSESLTVELTGNQTKIEAFLNLLGKEKILEMVRTGVTGLERGSKARGEMWDD